MAKKIKFESFKYHFLIAAENLTYIPINVNDPNWDEFVRKLEFSYQKGLVRISWVVANPSSILVTLDKIRFYLRGDTEKHAKHQLEAGLISSDDSIKLKNNIYFKEIVMHVAKSAGYKKIGTSPFKKNDQEERIQIEREFHDSWAGSEDVEKIDVRSSNEVCTAPEMRYITQRLGNIKGKRLLDIGCGLGESSVFFAMHGAEVTASDLSQGMLDATARLAYANNVSIKQHLTSAENMELSLEEKFDIIYAGNLLHHVDIEETISRIKPHLARGGKFVTWDPLAYNPAINAYRILATDVRTPDEHPLKWSDIKIFHKHFKHVETRYFWLTTLIVFVLMFIVQRRNPNKERFWKAVVKEGEKWSWLYLPLEKIDRFLLMLIPPLRLLCWNVVVVASNPKKVK